MNRRDFIFYSTVTALGVYSQSGNALAGSIFVANSVEQKANIILGGGTYSGKKDGPKLHVLAIIDLRTQGRHLTPMTFLPHGIHRKPGELNRLAIFEKKGPGACEYDLDKREIIRVIPKRDDRYFYGHGAYSKDGSTLFCTEANIHTLDGAIAIRSSNDLTYLGDFPSYGKEPHECKLIDDGKILVVTNGGGGLGGGDQPSVTYIDVQSQQLLEKVQLTNNRFNTGHMAVGSDGSLVVVSAPRSGLGKRHVGGVSIRPRGEKMESIGNPLDITQKMFGEALSVVIHEESGIAAVTHPTGDMITFWSVNERKLIKVLKLPNPRGVALSVSGEQFLITYSRQANFAQVSVSSLELIENSIIPYSFLTGSHIYNWSRKMSELFYPGPLV